KAEAGSNPEASPSALDCFVGIRLLAMMMEGRGAVSGPPSFRRRPESSPASAACGRAAPDPGPGSCPGQALRRGDGGRGCGPVSAVDSCTGVLALRYAE